MKMVKSMKDNNWNKSLKNKAQEKHQLILKTQLHLTRYIVPYRLKILIVSSKSKHKSLKLNGNSIKLGNLFVYIF